ncbi:MAG: pyrrolo-quinoline quinone [Acidobacteria bacterium]|nr:pyrrolo-quinoline quinone [Acidobacteriota bacterium]MBV9144426.1 pyrrolo-quinoline quinone [Acidobacteriota bacterium]MBV9437106.1 pyrrolo-quinoline quinone [Acidobacteriota bacterium]
MSIALLFAGCGSTTPPQTGKVPDAPPPGPGQPPPPPPPVPGPPPGPGALVDVLTHHYDAGRTGANTSETVLTPANVNSNQFGKLFAFAVDGQLYAQPLYLSGVSIPGKGPKNVVYAATEHDSVYAFDADGGSLTPLWQRSFINPSAGITTVSDADLPQLYEDIAPEIGITGTPVIDAASGTLYVVTKTKENGNFVQRLHALDVATGDEKFGGPVTIQASVPGSGARNDGNGNVVFDPLINLQRAALLLSGNTVYVAFGSHGDFDPFNGWILGYDAHNLKQVLEYTPDADGAGGSVWQAGGGPAADSGGNIYVQVANGDFDAAGGGRDYGDSAVKLQPSGSTFNVLDYFTPFDQQTLNQLDHDLGAGGVVLLPDQPDAPSHLLLASNKEGKLYIVDRDNMGHLHAGDDSQILQTIQLGGGIFSTPAALGNKVYVSAVRDSLKCYTVNAGHLTLSSDTGQILGYPGSTPVISANGNSNGIVWTLQVDHQLSDAAVLHAYDANDLSHELYNSTQMAGRDQAGALVKFTVPVVVNGKVYVGGGDQLTVYGLIQN